MSRIPEISVNNSKRKINHIMETEIHVPVGSPVIRKFPIFVEENNVTDGAMKLIKQLRPAWDMNHVKTKVRLTILH